MSVNQKSLFRISIGILFYLSANILHAGPDPMLVKRYTDLLENQNEIFFSDLNQAETLALTVALRGNNKLEKLSLFKCFMNEESADVFKSVLKDNNKLQKIMLSQCKINNTIAVEIAQGLVHNKQLKWLSLGNNPISNDGAKAFADALKTNIYLEGLVLVQTMINDLGAGFFGDSLKNNNSLVQLNLPKSISSEISNTISAELEKNKVIANILKNPNFSSKIKLLLAHYLNKQSELARLPKELILEIINLVFILELQTAPISR